MTGHPFLLRLILTTVAAAGTWVFVLVPLSLVPGLDRMPGVRELLALLAALGAGLLVWRHTGALSPGLASSVVTGAVVLGGIGFALGFFGPMLLAPRANQGPMLGIFITGPLGFLLGGVGGGIRWWWRQRAA